MINNSLQQELDFLASLVGEPFEPYSSYLTRRICDIRKLGKQSTSPFFKRVTIQQAMYSGLVAPLPNDYRFGTKKPGEPLSLRIYRDTQTLEAQWRLIDVSGYTKKYDSRKVRGTP